MLNKIRNHVENIKQTKPLILNITNYVTMDFMANCLLSLGASPIMSVEEKEIEELVKISSAINLNIGTLNEDFIKRAKFTCEIAKHYNKPIVLDPVGAGASRIRIESISEIIEFIDILKGNASEIIAIENSSFNGLGVDSTHQVSSAQESARKISQKYKITAIITGPEDFITDGNNDYSLNFGSNLMPLVTGTGCCLGAIIAAFRAVIPNNFEASVVATAYFNLCGQIAAENAQGPGSFKSSFIDNLYQPNWNKITELLK